MPWSLEIESRDLAHTLAIGRAIGSALASGDVIGLVGELGAGKTYLAKGIAAGLGVADERAVSSPTFVLVNEYDGRCRICHVDAYRLDKPADLDALGFDEMVAGPNVVLVEWADRVARSIGPDALWIHIEILDDTRRRVRMKCAPATSALACRLAAAQLEQV